MKNGMTRISYRTLKEGLAVEVDARIDQIIHDPVALDELKGLWREAPLMVFRKQSIEESEQLAFSNAFGTCETIPRKDIVSPYHEEVIYFSTLRYADGSFIGGFAGGEDVDWHSDQSFQASPSTGALLYGLEVPKSGGDIYWADQYAAWESLPEDIRQAIDGRTGLYSYAKRFAIMSPTELKDPDSEQAKRMRALPDVRHPVVLTHPHTGRKALYADPTTLVSIDGLSEEENARILPVLFAAAGDEAHVYRHRVHNGDVMMWDNGCTLHRRDEMRIDQPRLMKRTTFRLPATDYCTPQ
jgi:taurine dioxygenase